MGGNLADSIVGCLLFAWFLSIFGVDRLLVKGLEELFNLKCTIASYYTLFFIAGIILGMI